MIIGTLMVLSIMAAEGTIGSKILKYLERKVYIETGESL